MEDQLTIRLPRELSKALKERAAQMQRKPSEVVRLAVKEFLQNPEQPASAPAELVRDLIGALKSGTPDLATRHREYLVKKLKRGRELLLDTGALVGLLDRSQTVHEACAGFYATWQGPVVTTEAVLTEATHLLSGIRQGLQTCIDFILRGRVVLVPSSAVSLQRCRQLLQKYSDVPMDFADSTLVVLAEELDTDVVFTVDRDFLIYRIHGRKRFRIVPDVS